MALGLYTNGLARRAALDLAATSSAVAASAARLASGVRLLAASDDPVGIGVADGLRHGRLVAARAMRNATDAVAALAVGDAALAEVGRLLDRMAELAGASAGAPLDAAGRAALQAEFAGLLEAVDRLATGTRWNGLVLLGGVATVDVQVGFGGDPASRTAFATADVRTATLFGTTPPSVATAGAAAAALDVLRTAAAAVADARAGLGAAQTGLLATVDRLALQAEGFAAAERRIRDADVAVETARFSRARLLAVADAALLVQANLAPARVLQLLRSQVSDRPGR